jgi:hypothetical protein
VPVNLEQYLRLRRGLWFNTQVIVDSVLEPLLAA